MKRVVAEMGGKNAIIVDADADLDDAVPAIVQSAFGYAGQKCSAASRVIVVDRRSTTRSPTGSSGATELVPIGHPRDPATVVGPLIDEDALDAGPRLPGARRTEGRVLAATHRRPRCAAGTSARRSSRSTIAPLAIATEEIFGPVLALLRARDFDHALAIANDTDYALTAGCFSRTPSHLEQAADELRAGNVYLNRGHHRRCRRPAAVRRLRPVRRRVRRPAAPTTCCQFVEPRSISENTLRQGFTPD